MMDDDDPRLLDYLDPELLEQDEDDDGNPVVAGIDGQALKERVSAGIPLRAKTVPGDR